MASTPSISNKRPLLVNRLLLIGAGAAFVHAGIDAIYASWAVVGTDINISLWMLFLYWLNRQGHHNLVRFGILISLSLVLLAYSSVIPAENGLNLLFLPMMSLAFVLFEYHQHGTKLLISLFLLGCFLLLEYTDYELLGKLELQEKADRPSFIINFLTAGVLLFISLNYITQANHSAEQQLEQKTRELEEQNQLLSKTNQELDRFVYSTSHDLRAPLASMLGLLHLLENKDEQESLEPYLNMMRNRIHNLEDFISDIRTYAHNIRLPLEPDSLVLAPLVAEVLNTHRYLQPDSSLQLRQAITLREAIIVDQQRLSTILNNLVSNAIKYHCLEGDPPYICVGAQLEEKQLHLWVEDNGPGIEAAVQARMFEMFYRGNERSGGSGLGLYLVKEALEKMGGSIMVESEPGKGSTFHVWIPIQVQSSLGASPAAHREGQKIGQA